MAFGLLFRPAALPFSDGPNPSSRFPGPATIKILVQCVRSGYETLGSDPKPFRSSDLVPAPDAESTQAAIILLLLIGEAPIFWLLVWEFQVPMLLVVALVSTVRVKPCLLR